MAFSGLELTLIKPIMDSYINRRRPKPETRHEFDIGFAIEGQSVIIHEIHLSHDGVSHIRIPVAKARWVKKHQIWKLYWMRADLKWHSYRSFKQTETLHKVLEVVDADIDGCIWG